MKLSEAGAGVRANILGLERLPLGMGTDTSMRGCKPRGGDTAILMTLLAKPQGWGPETRAAGPSGTPSLAAAR